MPPKCPLCGGAREPGRTTFTAALGFGVVVRHVPGVVCTQCGEGWIDDRVAAALESAVADSRAKRSQFDVSDWSDRVV